MDTELTLSQNQTVEITVLNSIAESNQREMEDSAKMVSRYRHEKVTNKDYNGRQLLELIQNADDAGSDTVKIILDTADKNLKVINTGNSFTMEGFRSLMIPNLSPKRKKTYIGNKGLGFRSVLNWSKRVEIYSAGVSVEFSLELAAKEFDELYPSLEEKSAVLTEFQYNSTVIPYPVFAVPYIRSCEMPPGQTTIEITYLDDPSTLKSIRDQLADLRKEVLLFLNHITEIILIDDGELTSYKADKTGNEITIGEVLWTIFDNKDIDGEDPKLPDSYRDPETTEVESYSLKIAVQKNLKDNVNKLFSFFPTKVGLNFPAVIHGTFELDSSRNQIVESAKNTFLVEQLLNLMFEVCLTIEESSEFAGWNRLRFLNHNGQRDPEFARLGFYDEIDKWLRQAPILPCFDRKFKSINGVKILTGEFADVVQALSRSEHFPELLIAIPVDLSNAFSRLFPNYLSAHKYTAIQLKERIEEASQAMAGKVTSDEYASWIAAVKTLFSYGANESLRILYGEDFKIADNQISLFTPSEKSEIDIPPHVNMFYLHEELYKALLTRMRVTGDPISRKFRDDIENFAKIFPFEPANVLEKIVSETITFIEGLKSIDEKLATVKAMIISLFRYYSGSDAAKKTTISNTRIPIISATGKIIMTRDAFLSEKYQTGIRRQNILGDLYSPDEQVADLSSLGIDDELQAEDFLVNFIKVNRFVVIEKVPERSKYDHAYNTFVFERKGQPERFRDARIIYSSIKNYEQLQTAMNDGKLSRERLIAWICLDPEIKAIVESSADTEFYYNITNATSNVWPLRFYDVPSYIAFQLRKLIGLDNYVLDNDGISFLNDFTINDEASCFKANEIGKARVKDTLRQLGAKADFSELTIEQIQSVLGKMQKEDPKGKQARKIYLLCTDRFKNKGEYLKNRYGLMLHATLGDKRDYFPYNQVYYARTIGLPKKITNEKPILNFPKRGNETSVVNFLGVQTFDNINFQSERYTLNEYATKELNGYLKLLRPFILLRRLSRNKNIPEAVRILKRLTINICSELFYNINGEIREADNYDFVLDRDDNQTWLVRYNGVPSIDALKKDSFLSDVISEIYSIVFDLTNLTDEIRTIYRDDYKDTWRRFDLEYGDDELQNMMSKLEVSDKERSFWETIYAIQNVVESIPSIEDERDFRKQVAKTLHIESGLFRKIDFEELSSDYNLGSLKNLFSALAIRVSDFNSHSSVHLSFAGLHKEPIIKYVENLKTGITRSLWTKLKNGSTDEKKAFSKTLVIIPEETAKFVAPLFSSELEPAFDTAVHSFLNDRYGISGMFSDVVFNDHLETFAKNKALLGCTREEQINTLNEQDRSLLYFDLGEDELQRIKALLERNQLAMPLSSSEPFSEEAGSKQVTDMQEAGPNANRNPRPHLGPNRGGSRGSHSAKQDEVRNELGLKAELAVKEALEDKIYEWLSGYSDRPEKSDNWGFDFRYKDKAEDDWSYAEVKWFEKGTLYFTDTEYRVAEKYPENYFLYLVSTQGIQKIQFSKLLDENGGLNFNNNYFYMEISEYRFTKLV